MEQDKIKQQITLLLKKAEGFDREKNAEKYPRPQSVDDLWFLNNFSLMDQCSIYREIYGLARKIGDRETAQAVLEKSLQADISHAEKLEADARYQYSPEGKKPHWGAAKLYKRVGMTLLKEGLTLRGVHYLEESLEEFEVYNIWWAKDHHETNISEEIARLEKILKKHGSKFEERREKEKRFMGIPL